ncbi:prepilin-type N-terminal cleavage/methylation domain-containing protein [Massilia sp. S19_KUP03_FR1]|uniref:prepilin-type N-terminal cleavage/methylation domain-containing protein n=1 Tax=Massilia sp. S19_KUP03_FR1 TaxID=3025503 RepID=UPI002FCD876A
MRSVQRGFTLVEAVIVIAIIGIIGAIVAVFIRLPVQNYADSVARAEVSDEADLALRRMARELRMALPNSLRVTSDGSAIEFLLTKTGGRYLALEDQLASTFPILDFGDSTRTNVTLLGTLSEPIATTDFFVVNNLGEGMTPADAWGLATADRNIARVRTALPRNAIRPVLELVNNPFAAQSPSMPSPDHRYQIVSGPVTYACARASDNALVLTRYAGYGINVGQVNPPVGAGSVAPLSRRVNNCAGIFTLDTAAQRSALVNITLALAARSVDGAAAVSSIRLVHQVHVDNTP